MPNETDERVQRQRWRLLLQLTAAAELPMAVLSVVWLILLVVELAVGLAPPLAAASYVVWGLFVLQFALEFVIAPRKGAYLKRNWITAVALALPAFRLLRVLRILRFLRLAAPARSLSLVRVLFSLNRGMKTVRRFMARRGLGYVLALTVIVYFVGAAAMLAFEGVAPESGDGPRQGFSSYGHALWWTAMIIATMGTDYWPRSAEGRVLCSFLAIYGFSVFGYITAMLATYFIGADRKQEAAQPPGPDLQALASELSELRRALAAQPRGQAALRAD